MRAAFSMQQDPAQQSGITAREAARLLSTGKVDEMMDTIYNKYVEYRRQHDLIIIEGLSGFEPGLGNVNDLNAKIAATLEAPVLLVLDSRTKQGFSSANDLANSVVSSAHLSTATASCFSSAQLFHQLKIELSPDAGLHACWTFKIGAQQPMSALSSFGAWPRGC